jgi:hypothetical protein
MSNIVINVDGSSAGDGFLIAPDNGINFSMPLNLSTNDGTTVSATIDGTPNGADGKGNGLVFDHFGDFESFILETRLGELERFHSREKRVLEIVGNALEERSWSTVLREPKGHDQVRTIILRVPPSRDV